jgi:hypothetical protein
MFAGHLLLGAFLAVRRGAEIQDAVERPGAMSDEEARHASVRMAEHRRDAEHLMAELGQPGVAHQTLLAQQRKDVPHREPSVVPDVVRAPVAELPVK